LDVLMVHSSTPIIATDEKRLTCGVFSLGETVRFDSLEFNIDYFGNLSLSPKGSDSGTIFMRMTHSGSPSLQVIIEDSADEFYMTSSGEGSSGHPVSRRCSTGVSPTPIATTPWPQDAPATQTMTTVPRADPGIVA
jgi:hypothetical protein